jgi:hypothetical protein
MATNPGQYAPKVYPAWSDLEKQINTALPTTLRRIQAAEEGALRRLIHARRVKH